MVIRGNLHEYGYQIPPQSCVQSQELPTLMIINSNNSTMKLNADNAKKTLAIADLVKNVTYLRVIWV
ncbi:hypothetical protein CV014_01760 [Nostoc sp. CMAA1605]|nr:hypothetical protein [Nostoc sp. CMAA1605]